MRRKDGKPKRRYDAETHRYYPQWLIDACVWSRKRERQSLRTIARIFGVSHEVIRTWCAQSPDWP